MVTGDHFMTGIAVSQQIGLMGKSQPLVVFDKEAPRRASGALYKSPKGTNPAEPPASPLGKAPRSTASKSETPAESQQHRSKVTFSVASSEAADAAAFRAALRRSAFFSAFPSSPLSAPPSDSIARSSHAPAAAVPVSSSHMAAATPATARASPFHSAAAVQAFPGHSAAVISASAHGFFFCCSNFPSDCCLSFQRRFCFTDFTSACTSCFISIYCSTCLEYCRLHRCASIGC